MLENANDNNHFMWHHVIMILMHMIFIRIRLLSKEIRGQCDDVPDISTVMYSSVMVP